MNLTLSSRPKHFLKHTFFALSLGLVGSLNAHAEKIKVGAVFANTGAQATFGQEAVNGIRLAMKKMDPKKLKGNTIEIIYEDNKSEPMETANAVRKLINIDKVSVIMGEIASSNTLAGAPIAQESGIPMISPGSTNEAVTKKGDFISRVCFIDDFQGAVMARFAFDQLKKKTAIVLTDNASDYSKGLTKVFEAEFTRLGGKLLEKNLSYVAKDPDFRTLLTKIKRLKPDVVFVPGYYSDVGNILRQAKQMTISIPFLGTDGWDSPKLHELAGKDAVAGNYISSHFAADDVDPKVQQFVKDYEQEYKIKPGSMAALGYDTLGVVVDAISRVKRIAPSEIKTAINSTKNFQGITGNITLDANRNAVKSAVIIEVVPGGFKFKAKVDP